MENPALFGEKVLVIGANSFIGSHLVPALQCLGCKVFTSSKSAHLDNSNPPINRIVDITNASAIEALFAEIQPAYVFNLAGYVQGARTLENLWPTFKVNLEGSVNVLNAVRQFTCKRLILLGSQEELLAHPQMPPVSPYAASKVAASNYARMFHALFDVPVVIAQLFITYGPNQKDPLKLVPYTINSLLRNEIPRFSSGVRLADWMYIDDAVEGLLCLATCPGIEGASIELGTGRLTSVKEIVDYLFYELKINIPPNFGALEDRKMETGLAANIQETQNRIGWEAKIPLEEGLRRTVQWYKQQFEQV